MTDFRALCEELVEELEVWIGYGDEADCADAHVVVDRARAALAEQPVAPTDDQIDELWDKEAGYYELYEEVRNVVRAVLARWGTPAIEPVVPTDEELDTTARAAKIQYIKEYGGLTASTPDGIYAQLQAQRLAGLRAVAARWGQS